MFTNYIEINMEEDKLDDRMKEKENTLVFIDEIQAYYHLLTLVKFLMQEKRFTYIASGSQLGVSLKNTQSVPVGSRNVLEFRSIQNEAHTMYGVDASKYEEEHNRKLKIRRIFDMIPSNLENKKKRVVIKDIEDKSWKRSEDYLDEFEYLISSGIALEVKAISTPTYPLVERTSDDGYEEHQSRIGV